MPAHGSIAYQDKYSSLFLDATAIGGVIVPIAAVICGVAAGLGFVDRSPLYSSPLAIAVYVIFVLLAVSEYLVKPSTPLRLGIFIGLYHAVSIAYLIFGTGILGPFTLCWVVLTITTNIFFGRASAALSLVLFTATCLFLFLVEPVFSTETAFQYLMYMSIVVISSLLISGLLRVQVVEHQDLERSQTQEHLQRSQLTTLINSIGVAIVSTNKSGTIRIYNAALLNLLDTNQSLTGKKLEKIINLHDSSGEPVTFSSLTHALTHQVERDDLYHHFDDDETIRLNIGAAPIRGKFSSGSNQSDGFIFIIRDITQEKSLEEERNEFISVVSHELRTPITIAEGTLSNLQFLLDNKKDVTMLSPALKEAHEQILYLANMVNDLSTLSRAERSVADAPETVDIKAVCEELYHRYHAKAEEKGLALNLDLGHNLGLVVVSPLYLEEVLQNFVTNAIKYTRKGAVTLAVHRHGLNVEFAVHDTGIGISKSDQKRIFEKFYRSEDYRTRETTGTGLGLYVVHKLADKLNTKIDVESRLNHGSTFSFVLAAAPNETPAESA